MEINKNKINKDKLIEFMKKECVLVIAILLAIVTSFISFPKIEYIDFKVLILLFNLMIIVAAFKELEVLDFIAVSIVKKCKSDKSISLAMIAITFFASMLVTNDVALITFVPITLIIGSKVNLNIIKLVVLQTIGANLGSSLTPMGNPQNLFIYTFYNLSPVDFFKVTLPITLLAIVFLIISVLMGEKQELQVELNEVKVGSKNKIISFSIILVIILLSVFHLVDYKVAFIITIISVCILNASLFKKVDYSLLFTFIGFFIFIGNISNMNSIKVFMESLLKSGNNTYYTGIISSQIISNVPATMLLSGFTGHFKELLLGVNIGGLGTLIASLASVISYKLYANYNKEKVGEFIKVFTIYNFALLVSFTIIIRIFILN